MVQRRIIIPELNSLRFIFMVMIFFHHMNNCTMFPPGGYLAVTFFFVLSGFSMTIGYRDRLFSDKFSYKHYIFKRLTKFYPIHWLVLLYIIATSWGSVVNQDYFAGKLMTNFFLLQSFVPIQSFYFSFNSPSWYLCNTLFYCLLFPYILKTICRCGRLTKLVIMFIIIIFYILLVIFVPKEYHHAIIYVNPFVRLFDFVLGMYSGLFFLHLIKKSEKSSAGKQSILGLSLLTLLCFALVAWVSFYNIDKSIRFYMVRYYWIVLCPMIISVSLISVRRFNDTAIQRKKLIDKLRISNLMQWGGQFSYTFYMIHLVCIGLFASIGNKYGLCLWQVVIITFVGTMIASVIVQKFFVDPIGRYLMKIIR